MKTKRRDREENRGEERGEERGKQSLTLLAFAFLIYKPAWDYMGFDFSWLHLL